MSRRGENIRKRSDGRWEGRYIKARNAGGQAIYGFIYGKTYSEVKTEKMRCLNNLKQNCGNSSGQAFDALCDDWLHFINSKVKESTYAKYFRICKMYLSPYFSGAKLNQIEHGQIEHFTEYLMNGGGLRKQSLSAKTAADILTVVKQIFKYGKKDIEITLPKQKKPAIHVLSVNEQIQLEKCLLGSSDLIRLGVLLDLYTGLRLGELCALKWGDFDFNNACVHVCRSVSRIQNTDASAKRKTKLVIQRPKTDSSERCIPLPDFLLQYLKPFRYGDGDYLLTGTDQLIEPRHFSLKYKKILSDCRLSHYNFHALRHTFATRCVENGFDIKSLSEILGHADVKTTLSRYVHPSLEMKRREMDKLSVIFNSSIIFSH